MVGLLDGRGLLDECRAMRRCGVRRQARSVFFAHADTTRSVKFDSRGAFGASEVAADAALGLPIALHGAHPLRLRVGGRQTDLPTKG